MRLAFLLMIAIGLLICFGGVYIRKICSGLLGFFWGNVLGLCIAMKVIDSGYGADEKALGIMLVCGIATCIISVVYEAVCVLLNAFISSFIVALLFLSMLSTSLEDYVIILIAFIVALVVAEIAYLYYRYIFIFLTAFSGGSMASVGFFCLIKGDYFIYGILYGNTGISVFVLTIVLCVLGCIVQNRQLKKMLGHTSKPKAQVFYNEQGQIEQPPEPNMDIYVNNFADTWNELNLLNIIKKEWYLLIPPAYIFIFWPFTTRFTTITITNIWLGILQVFIGMYIGGMIYLLMAYDAKISVIYAALHTICYVIVSFEDLSYMISYRGLIYIGRYLVIWGILYLIKKFLQNDKIKPVVMIVVAALMHSFGIEFLRFFDIYYLQMSFRTLLCWVFIFGTMYFLYKFRLGMEILDFTALFANKASSAKSGYSNPYDSFGTSPQQPNSFCSHCGAAVTSEANFCKSCGKPLR